MTPIVWMFLKNIFDSTRRAILKATSSTLIQMETHASMKHTLQLIHSLLRKDSFGCNIRHLYQIDQIYWWHGRTTKENAFKTQFPTPRCLIYIVLNKRTLRRFPGSPIAYWASQSLIHDFEIGTPMGSILEPRQQGLATADNNRFLRQWYEVEPFRISFTSTSTEDALKIGGKVVSL